MIDGWLKIANDLKLYSVDESTHHPHEPQERASLFHSADNGSTEFEFLNLLHALVLALKPELVLETGTFKGYGSLAIASALKSNGIGHLITVDRDPCDDARALFKRFELEDTIYFHHGDSLDFCRKYGGNKFEMAFHDSGGDRRLEHEILMERDKMGDGSFVVFHDTSLYRHGPHPNEERITAYSVNTERVIDIRNSRGLKIVQQEFQEHDV